MGTHHYIYVKSYNVCPTPYYSKEHNEQTLWSLKPRKSQVLPIFLPTPPQLTCLVHMTVMLIPAYKLFVKCAEPSHRQAKTPGTISGLQDCYGHVDWNMFKEDEIYGSSTNLEEYKASVT